MSRSQNNAHAVMDYITIMYEDLDLSMDQFDQTKATPLKSKVWTENGTPMAE